MSSDAPTQTLESLAPQPTLRIRVEHSRTIKDGWSYSTTVELDGVEVGAGKESRALYLLEFLLKEVRQLGENERDERNQRDNALKEATTT